MKVFKKIIATLLVAASMGSLNIHAEKPYVPKIFKMAMLNDAIREKKVARAESSLIQMVHFKNTIPELLKLSDEFSNPAYLDAFLKHFDFMINDQAIPVYESKAVAIRKDRPFTFSIKAKRGKLESLLAMVKTSTQDWFKTTAAKALNYISFGITYACHLNYQHMHNDIICMDELVYEHPDMREIMQDPSKIKQYLTWPEWRSVEAQLPDLKIHHHDS